MKRILIFNFIVFGIEYRILMFWDKEFRMVCILGFRFYFFGVRIIDLNYYFSICREVFLKKSE